jgi:hypothetical protein
MDKRYVFKIVNGRSIMALGHVHFIAYKHPTLMLRFGAAHRSNVPRFAKHAEHGTILTYRLDWEENELWESPSFRARVTFGPDEQGQFELTLLDTVDLSGLQERHK